MTADEIKRALKTCSVPSACVGCVYKDADECIRALIADALELIDNQDERIAIMREGLESYETRLTWINAQERLPSASGDYLVHTPSGWITTMKYSAKWQAFNVQDDNDEKRVADNRIIPTHWLPLPEPPAEVYG